METSIIPEAKESTAGPQQREGYVDRFFSTPVELQINNCIFADQRSDTF
jgi:hypothetical protein